MLRRYFTIHPRLNILNLDKICLYGGSIIWTLSKFEVVFSYSPQIHKVSEMAGHCKKVPCDVIDRVGLATTYGTEWPPGHGHWSSTPWPHFYSLYRPILDRCTTGSLTQWQHHECDETTCDGPSLIQQFQQTTAQLSAWPLMMMREDATVLRPG